ncbi:hypothetical protein QLX67_06055 [Balneolaceae bacterium ANBcel3]|nr:hypothetical protein [Balneolaceae bacterium ANBcel3]
MKKNSPDIVITTDGFRYMDEVMRLNKLVFNESRLINRMDHEPLLFLTAHSGDALAGFKIGYALNRSVFYSAKGAIHPLHRRKQIATHLLYRMMEEATGLGFIEFQYDTFPARYPGMLILGLKHKFKIIQAIWNPEFNDFQVRLSRTLNHIHKAHYPEQL